MDVKDAVRKIQEWNSSHGHEDLNHYIELENFTQYCDYLCHIYAGLNCVHNIELLMTMIRMLRISLVDRLNRSCVVCGKASDMRCSCKLDCRYCSDKCQKVDWPRHSKYCKLARKSDDFASRASSWINMKTAMKIPVPVRICTFLEKLQCWNAENGYDELNKYASKMMSYVNDGFAFVFEYNRYKNYLDNIYRGEKGVERGKKGVERGEKGVDRGKKGVERGPGIDILALQYEVTNDDEFMMRYTASVVGQGRRFIQTTCDMCSTETATIICKCGVVYCSTKCQQNDHMHRRYCAAISQPRNDMIIQCEKCGMSSALNRAIRMATDKVISVCSNCIEFSGTFNDEKCYVCEKNAELALTVCHTEKGFTFAVVVCSEKCRGTVSWIPPDDIQLQV